jgi:cation diffusion facilitator family transporter
MAHQHDHHGHEHSHYHIHTNELRTRIVVLISVVTMGLELFAGYRANSIALIMDGWHMLSHVLVLMLAWGAYFYIQRGNKQITHRQQHKVIALSGFASSTILLVITGLMIKESIEKFYHLEVAATNEAFLIAGIGLVVNGTSAYLLHREEEKMDLSLRAAYLHVLADVVLSVLALVSLVAARQFNLFILDPICGLLGAVIILRWAIGLIKRSWVEVLELRA